YRSACRDDSDRKEHHLIHHGSQLFSERGPSGERAARLTPSRSGMKIFALHREYDLSDVRSRLHVTMRVGRLLERKRLRHDRTQASFRDLADHKPHRLRHPLAPVPEVTEIQAD